MKPITWEPRKVAVADLKENPKNPKILNEKGKARLQTSLGKFGLAGTIVVNKDLTIIDGHSRKKELLESEVTEVWVSVPSRQLTKKEYLEFNAIFDLAVAGDSDLVLIEEIVGEAVFEEYGLNEEEVERQRRDVSGNVGPRYKVTVECESVKDQETLYNMLVRKGYACKTATR